MATNDIDTRPFYNHFHKYDNGEATNDSKRRLLYVHSIALKFRLVVPLWAKRSVF